MVREGEDEVQGCWVDRSGGYWVSILVMIMMAALHETPENLVHLQGAQPGSDGLCKCVCDPRKYLPSISSLDVRL